MKKVEAIWLAGALLTYEKFIEKENIKIEDLYFKQSEIVKKAEEINKDKIPPALASSHCVANASGSIYNYLVAGDFNDSIKRRLSYYGEFNNQKERPALNREITVTTIMGQKKIAELYEFIEGKFTHFILTNPIEVFDCQAIFTFLKEYAGKEYRAIERAEEEIIDDLKRIKEAGQIAVAELEKLANICRARFGFKKFGRSAWLDVSGRRTREYLWRQMKKPGHADCKSSLSFFAEKDEKNEFRLRISIELAIDNSDQQDYKRHHQLLNRPLKKGLCYVIDSNDRFLTTDNNDVVKEKVKNGSYQKVQISFILTETDIKKNDYSSQEILNLVIKAIKELIPYYKIIIEEDSPKMSQCNINTILYGPPGTGKTYNTVNYAVSIIENKEFMAICAEAYQDVFERYLTYKKQGQIRFVTFHQSYGYEEFIEGIKPVLNDEAEESIQYKIESGVFKEFCEQAQQLKLTAHDQVMEGNKKVWKISLGGSGKNWLKEECFKDNQIRIGWDEEGTDFIEDGEYPSDTLYYFYEGMSVGDIVFSLGDQKHIDAIGIITGEPQWLEAEEDFKRSREVEWIATDIYENIYELNGKTNLVQQTIYELWRLSINDVNNLILKYSQNNQIDVEENTNNYVFIIDEINRGNISKIFGELITLIEPTKRIGALEEMHVKLPYSKKDFGVPQNVYLLGTMNTADRSIALMDTALRRRFDFIEMLPNLNAVADIKVGHIHIQRLMEVMNARIEALYDREHTIGHAYFMSLKEDSSLENLANIFKNAIIPLLQEYFYEDYSKIQLVLGDHLKPQQYRFILDEKLSIKGLFGRAIDIDLPETKFHLQASAFEEPLSYIGIYGRVENEEVN